MGPRTSAEIKADLDTIEARLAAVRTKPIDAPGVFTAEEVLDKAQKKLSAEFDDATAREAVAGTIFENAPAAAPETQPAAAAVLKMPRRVTKAGVVRARANIADIDENDAAELAAAFRKHIEADAPGWAEELFRGFLDIYVECGRNGPAAFTQGVYGALIHTFAHLAADTAACADLAQRYRHQAAQRIAALESKIAALEAARPPALRYRGAYEDGAEYDVGEFVTDGGSVWHCNRKTKTRPSDGGENWTLAVKRGRDGRVTK